MKEILEKSRCTGCTACMSICPSGAIEMIEKNDGFKYPIINQQKCINCGLCKKTCPVLNTKENYALNECYAGYNKDEKSLMNKASSGSIFELVADYILEQGGIVVGAAFDSNNRLKHVAIEKAKDLLKLKGSKYLQSDLTDIFKYIKNIVKTQKVLFVGTPCQVAGIKSVIKNDNLITIDVVCHGVPTPKLFNKYINELENKYNSKVVDYNFRDKKTGWDSYSNTIKFSNNELSQLQKDNDYMKLFLSDVALRESCYRCNFKLGNKYSDITLGDFWEISKYHPDVYNNKGVSAIIINTKNGKEIFDIIKANMIYKKCNLMEIVDGNPSLKISSNVPSNREDFFKEIDNNGIEILTKKFQKKISIKLKIKNKIKKLIK